MGGGTRLFLIRHKPGFSGVAGLDAFIRPEKGQQETFQTDAAPLSACLLCRVVQATR
jgi:hypothetical protein